MGDPNNGSSMYREDLREGEDAALISKRVGGKTTTYYPD